jgi:hypothetical protein
MIRYFAYGSNMDEDDFEKQCNIKQWSKVNFQNTRPAKLPGYKIQFNYFSKGRGGGAANIMESPEDCVYGLLSEIEDSDLETIRKKEGYSEDCTKCYYNEICVNVQELRGNIVQFVKTYKVSKSRETPTNQSPTKEYLDLIINNAKKHGFPPEYIEYLNQIQIKK